LTQLAGAPANLSLTGKVSANFDAAGPLSATVLSLNLRGSQALWRDKALSNVEIIWDRDALAAQTLDTRFSWDQGQARLEAALSADGKHKGKFQAEGVHAAWLESVLGTDLQGKLQAQGS